MAPSWAALSCHVGRVASDVGWCVFLSFSYEKICSTDRAQAAHQGRSRVLYMAQAFFASAILLRGKNVQGNLSVNSPNDTNTCN